MNLLDYLPAHLIEIARQIALHKLITVSAPQDPNDLRMLVRGDPALEMQLALLGGMPVEAPDLHTLHAFSEIVRDGAKVIKPSVEVCRVLAQVELNLHLRDYAQPYHGKGVLLPGPLIGRPKDLFVSCWWRPGLGIHIGFYVDDALLYQTIGPHWPGTLEEILGVRDDNDWNLQTAEGQVVAQQVARICLNLGLFGMERGVRVAPLDPRAERRRRRARVDPHMAKLAARDAQEVVIQDLDLILKEAPSRPEHAPESRGRRQPMNRRRGHWKMQVCGPGRSERRRIYVSSYVVNADLDRPGDIATILS